MCSLIKTFIGNWVILESVSLDFVGSSLWGTKTFPHYLVVENHLDLKDGPGVLNGHYVFLFIKEE